MNNGISVALIGTGNVAQHLVQACISAEIDVTGVYGRNEPRLQFFRETFNIHIFRSLTEIKADLILVCVNDDAVKSVIDSLSNHQKIAYTSGSIDLSQFTDNKTIGVFYPLQTLTQNHEVNYKEIPFLIEAKTTDFSDELCSLAGRISQTVLRADSAQRKHIHFGAVWVNNFVNHMYLKGFNHLKEHNIDPLILAPLMKETVRKAIEIGPFAAQTGPAKRGDQHIIENQLQLAKETEKELYALITSHIQNSHLK
jgi:predicted short-subunit dehydrogenase-like oxidoreductase (DUF2520 family)